MDYEIRTKTLNYGCLFHHQTGSCTKLHYCVPDVIFFKTYIENKNYGICVDYASSTVEPSDRLSLFPSSSCVTADRTGTTL